MAREKEPAFLDQHKREQKAVVELKQMAVAELKGRKFVPHLYSKDPMRCELFVVFIQK